MKCILVWLLLSSHTIDFYDKNVDHEAILHPRIKLNTHLVKPIIPPYFDWSKQLIYCGGTSKMVVTSEKAYLHIDREIYNPGEDIWFKAYVVDFTTNKPVAGISKLYVDLISPESKILQRRTIRISEGLGNGDFKLSDSIPSGKYYIRAYTNFMRNFGEEYFFNKEIYIVGSNVETVFNDSIQFVQDKLNIDFFPEGGSLIDNVVSVVAFKATNPLGKGVKVNGQVFSDKGEHVNDFQSNDRGIGVFNLFPLEEESYYVLFSGPDGIQYKTNIPQRFSEGVVLHAFVSKENRLLLKILTNGKSFPLYSGGNLFLTISAKNLFSNILALKITSLSNNYSFPLDSFPPGILKLTLNDQSGKPLAERLIFKNVDGDIRVGIKTDKQTYDLREPIKATISLFGDTCLKAYASFSAFDSQMSTDSSSGPSNIASWFLLESEVRGEVENASTYFDLSNDSRLKQLDMLLLTQGWRDFAWKYDSAFQFKPESGFSIRGKILKSFKGKPYPWAKINIAIYDEKNISFLNIQADDQGNFDIGNMDFTGRARIIVSCEDQKKEFDGYVHLDSLTYHPPAVSNYSNNKVVLQDIKMSTIAESFSEFRLFQRKFKLSDTLSIGEVIITSKRRENSIEMDLRSSRAQYGKPDHEFILAPKHRNYIRISQVLAGNIPGVEVITSMNQSIVTIRGQTPLILVDGIPVGNELRPGGIAVDNFVSPSEIDRVDVLYWCSTFGSRGANGVINFITKRGQYSYESLNPIQAISIYRMGFNQPRIYYSPKHLTKYSEGQTPDFRKTIYWEPNLILSNKTSELNFYNSDEATEIFIKVEGITKSGIPIIGTHKYDVK